MIWSGDSNCSGFTWTDSFHWLNPKTLKENHSMCWSSTLLFSGQRQKKKRQHGFINLLLFNARFCDSKLPYSAKMKGPDFKWFAKCSTPSTMRLLHVWFSLNFISFYSSDFICLFDLLSFGRQIDWNYSAIESNWIKINTIWNVSSHTDSLQTPFAHSFIYNELWMVNICKRYQHLLELFLVLFFSCFIWMCLYVCFNFNERWNGHLLMICILELGLNTKFTRGI